MIRDFLRACKKDYEAKTALDWWDTSACYFILHTLDNHGLVEHGSSAGGCWLTQKGERVLALIESYGEDVEAAMEA
jgi:hypothetical protein